MISLIIGSEQRSQNTVFIKTNGGELMKKSREDAGRDITFLLSRQNHGSNAWLLSVEGNEDLPTFHVRVEAGHHEIRVSGRRSQLRRLIPQPEEG